LVSGPDLPVSIENRICRGPWVVGPLIIAHLCMRERKVTCVGALNLKHSELELCRRYRNGDPSSHLAARHDHVFSLLVSGGTEFDNVFQALRWQHNLTARQRRVTSAHSGHGQSSL